MSKDNNVSYVLFLAELCDKYGTDVVSNIPIDLISEAYIYNNLKVIERFINQGYITLSEVRKEDSCDCFGWAYSSTKHSNSDDEDFKSILSSNFTDSDFEEIMLLLIDRSDSLEEIDRSAITYEKIENSDYYKPATVPDEVKEKSRKYVNKQCAYKILTIIEKYLEIKDSNL